MHPLLRKMCAHGSFPPTVLLVGDRAIIKQEARTLALEAIEGKEGYHPDIHEILPEGKTGMHSLRSVKALLQEAALTPYKAKKKVFIIEDCERMLPASSNALLKNLEEPPDNVLFILLTQKKEELLPTLLSRCHIFYFPTQHQIECTELQKDFLHCLQKGDTGELIAKKIEEKRKEFEKSLGESSLEVEEIAGAATLYYQQQVKSLLEIYYLYHKDAYAAFIGVGKSRLLFPEAPPSPWLGFDIRVQEAQLGLERGMALRTILEFLLI